MVLAIATGTTISMLGGCALTFGSFVCCRMAELRRHSMEWELWGVDKATFCVVQITTSKGHMVKRCEAQVGVGQRRKNHTGLHVGHARTESGGLPGEMAIRARRRSLPTR